MKLKESIQFIVYSLLEINKNLEKMLQNKNHAESRLIPITKWNKYHPWPPIGGFRYIVHQETRNKSNPDWLIKSGTTLLIDEIKFFEWTRKRSDNIKESE